MTYLKKSVLIIFLVLQSLWLVQLTAEAEETGSGANFGVQPIYPENQRKDKKGHYNLSLKPEQEEVLKAKIINYSKEEIKVHYRVTRGTTTDSGLISYKEFDKVKDASINVDFNDLVTTKTEEVSIPVDESKEIEINVTMPKKLFEGTILGGVHFYQDDPESSEKTGKAVINTFSYSIPIVLTESEEVTNSLLLEDVSASQINGHNFIEATLHNVAPSIVRHMKIDAKVISKKDNETAYSRKEDNFKMAPNSTLKYGFDLLDTSLVSGKYQLIMLVDADGKTYEFDKKFEISKKEAKELNNSSVRQVEEPDSMIWLIVLSSIVGCLVTLQIILYTKKKKISKKTVRKSRKRKSITNKL